MRKACAQAASHYRREHAESDQPDIHIQVTVGSVPHLAPGVGDNTDWYEVGTLLIDPPGDLLRVYLDADSGGVKLEQALEDVPPLDGGTEPRS
jgi:hypothetical protein